MTAGIYMRGLANLARSMPSLAIPTIAAATTKSTAAQVRFTYQGAPKQLGGWHDKLVGTSSPKKAIANPTTNPTAGSDSARRLSRQLMTIRTSSQAIAPTPTVRLKTPYTAPPATPSKATGAPVDPHRETVLIQWVSV